jgi:hypothetical protein
MIDLINKDVRLLTQEELEQLKKLHEKYSDLVKFIFYAYTYEFAYVLEIGIEHIKNKHSTLPVDFKAWSMVLLKNMLEDKLLNLNNITTTIDEFVEYYNNEYNEYLQDIISVNDFERDRGFMTRFLNRKKQV